MKKGFILILLLTGYFSCQGQNYKAGTSIDFSGKHELTSYVSSNGTQIKLGDTLVLANPTNQTLANYNTLIYGKPESFGKILTATSSRYVNAANNAVPIGLSGTTVVVRQMYLQHYNGVGRAGKKAPIAVCMFLQPTSGKNGVGSKYLSTQSYEVSYSAGELKTLREPLSTTEIIAKLKEQKDLLETGLIDSATYEQNTADLKEQYKALGK